MYTLDIPDLNLDSAIQEGDSSQKHSSGWHFSNSGEIVQIAGRSAITSEQEDQHQTKQAVEITSVKHVTLNSTVTFENVVSNGVPVVLKRLSLGPCIERWTLDHLSKQLGEDRKVRDDDYFGRLISMYRCKRYVALTRATLKMTGRRT